MAKLLWGFKKSFGLWVGFSDSKKESQWELVNGAAYNQNGAIWKWGKKPDNGFHYGNHWSAEKNYDCAYVRKGKRQLFETKCAYKFYGICEIPTKSC